MEAGKSRLEKDYGSACVKIRLMESRDLEAVSALEAACFSIPWSACLLSDSMESRFDTLWVLEADSAILGYCDLRVIADEGELMRIAVLPEARGKGYARDLMETLVRYCGERGVRLIILEVRASNQSALKLYQSYDFNIQAVRKGYYKRPTEDALIMLRSE